MNNHRPYIWLYLVFLVEGLIALTCLLLIPSEGARISLARWGLIGVLLFFCGMWGYLGLRNIRALDKFARPGYILIVAIFIPLSAVILFLLRYFDPERYLPFYERLSPLLWYFLLLAIQLAFFLLYLYKGFHPANLLEYKAVHLPALFAMMVLAAVFILVSVTRLGLTYDPAYWGEPGVPILGWQFTLTLFLGLCAFFALHYFQSAWSELVIPVLIYLLAVLIWLSVPVEVLENSFYMRISAPDFQPYPFSDSSYYDQMAQSLLIGHPYQGVIPTRPLYIVFLMILHLVFGENYPNILVAQTFILATLPVVLYFIGKKIHGNIAGIVVALFFIFRELTSLLISSETRVTNTKMILVDLPTLLILLLTCMLVFRWLDDKKPLSAFIAGGFFGILLLLRTQSLLVLPFVILITLFELGWRSKSFYWQTFLFIVGLTLTIAPWLTHNYIHFGKLTFDADFQVNLLVSQYAAFGNMDIAPDTFDGKGLGYILGWFMLMNPQHVLGFISNHFLATLVNSLLVLPIIEPFNGLFEPINLYWMSWDGSTAWYNVFLFIFYLAVISLGLGAAWNRWRWRGLLPLAFSLGYAFATALSRFSSWRYDFPADWIAYFYFGVGFAELLSQSASMFRVFAPVSSDFPLEKDQSAREHSSVRQVAITTLAFVLVGGLPWMARTVISPRYSDQDPDRLMTQIASVDGAPTYEEIDEFASQPQAFLQIGRLLYPRFFNRGVGFSSGTPSPAYMIREFPRLSFYLLNQRSTAIVFPVDSMPGSTPHAEDVIILGCELGDHVEARLIVFPKLNKYYINPLFYDSCSN